MSKTPEEKAKEVVMMKDATEWPWGCICAVKSYMAEGRPFPRVGVITPGKPIVYLQNLFSIVGDTLEEIIFELEGVAKIEYPTWEAMVEDGWEVDY